MLNSQVIWTNKAGFSWVSDNCNQDFWTIYLLPDLPISDLLLPCCCQKSQYKMHKCGFPEPIQGGKLQSLQQSGQCHQCGKQARCETVDRSSHIAHPESQCPPPVIHIQNANTVCQPSRTHHQEAGFGLQPPSLWSQAYLASSSFCARPWRSLWLGPQCMWGDKMLQAH